MKNAIATETLREQLTHEVQQHSFELSHEIILPLELNLLSVLLCKAVSILISFVQQKPHELIQLM